MICSRCIWNFLFSVILLSSECSSLSPPNLPHQTTTTTSQNAESLSTLTCWRERAKQWAAAGVLSASLILGTNNVAPAMAAEGTVTVNPKPKVEVTVETDNLVRTLDYFQGDMKKTMGAVTAPTSSAAVVVAPKVDAAPQQVTKAPEQPPVEDAAKAPEKPVEAVVKEPEKPVESSAAVKEPEKPVEAAATAVKEPEKPVEAAAAAAAAVKEPEKPVEAAAAAAAAAVKEPEKPVEAAAVREPAKPEVLKQTTASMFSDESPLGDVGPALKNFADAVTEKKYAITLPASEGKAIGQTVMLSQLDFTIAAIVVGYPLTFGLWGQTELDRIEKMKAYREDKTKQKELGAERVKEAAAAAKKRAAEEKKAKDNAPYFSETEPPPYFSGTGSPAVNGGMDSKQPEQPTFGQAAGFVQPASKIPSNKATTMEGKDGDGNAFSLSLNNPDLQKQFDGKASINMKARIMQPGDPEGDFTITLDESMFEDVSPDAKRVVVRGQLESQDFSDSQFQ